MINKSSSDNFDIASHIAMECAISAESGVWSTLGRASQYGRLQAISKWAGDNLYIILVMNLFLMTVFCFFLKYLLGGE